VVEKRTSGFDMEVRYHNQRPNPAVPFTYEATLTSLTKWADFLMAVSTSDPETRPLVSADIL
jgi:hydroxypyruvate reductase